VIEFRRHSEDLLQFGDVVEGSVLRPVAQSGGTIFGVLRSELPAHIVLVGKVAYGIHKAACLLGLDANRHEQPLEQFVGASVEIDLSGFALEGNANFRSIELPLVWHS